MPDILYNASGLDLMLMLDKLHKMGYEKLRWVSYFAPTGLSLRCHITVADNIYADRHFVDFNKNIFATSVGSFSISSDIDALVKAFIQTFPELIKIGKGKDHRYRLWYKEVLKQAKKGAVPKFEGDYLCIPFGKIEIGHNLYPAPPGNIKLISWNIDGLKAKWNSLLEIVKKYSPDIICLQKVKHSGEIIELDGYQCYLSSAPYAGVCTYIKRRFVADFDEKIQDNSAACGYMQKIAISYPTFTLFNCYVPYSNPDVPGAVEHRQKYDKVLLSEVKNTSDRIILCGDLNIVHKSIDCWDEKHVRKQANFHSWERNDFERLLQVGKLVDTYREFHIFEKQFSYFFRNDPEVRKNNQGHRIDYFLASRSFVPYITQADIIKDITTSTNNPILLTIEY